MSLNKIFSKNQINTYINQMKIIYLDVNNVTKFFTELDKIYSFALTKLDSNQFVTLR